MSLNEFEKAQISYNKTQLIEMDNTNKVLDDFYNIIEKNMKEIEDVYKIEEKYNDSLDGIENILKNVKKEKKTKKYLEQIKREDGFIVSKYKDSIGVIGVIFNGNTYVMLELLKKAINTKNAFVFCTNNKKFGVNKLLILYFKEALKLNGYDEDLIQIINSENYSEMYEHNNILRKIIVVGNSKLQNQVLSKSKIEVITSGYDCFDIYIEDIMDIKLIEKILNVKNVEFNIYINKEISEEEIAQLNIDDYTEVENVEECIRDLNINSAGYSSSIFSKNPESANKFLKLVKTKNVFVNASPTLERTLDIQDRELLYTKQVMYINK